MPIFHGAAADFRIKKWVNWGTRVGMYFAALISLILSAVSALLAYFWDSRPRSSAEHWIENRKRRTRVRKARMSALYLGATALVLGGVPQLWDWSFG